MLKRTDGWHLELVAFGGGGVRADERMKEVGGLKELRQVPLAGDGWERLDYALALDAKAGHERLPIHVTILAYGGAERDDFVPDLTSADAVLLVESGNADIDTRTAAIAAAALAKRLGAPPVIVEHGKSDGLKNPLRSLVKRTIQALKTGELHEFWKQRERNAEEAHDEAVFGALTKDKILGQKPGELVAFMLRVVQARGRRAVKSGRLPTSEAYDRCLSQRWQRLLAVNALEMLIKDAGVSGVFSAPGARAMEREEVTVALAGLKRIGATKKVAIIERALAVAREANLWEGSADPMAAKAMEELSTRFYAIDDEPLRVRLEDDIRKAPNDYTLGVYED